MATYSWPANVAKNDAGWVASLVDWPLITPINETAQGSVLAASQQLSDEIRLRLENRASITLPSELKPGQVQIPVDADASARLDTYVEQEEEKRLKRHSEIEQANREKRVAFLSEFRANQAPIERLRDHADEAAINFASIGVKFGYILNGGALVAIPAILQFADEGTLSKGHLLLAIILFVSGIILSALTNYLAYQSVFIAGEGHGKECEARAIDVSIAYYPPEDPSVKQAEVKSIRADNEDVFKQAKRLADFGVKVFGLSVLAFLIGVGIIIYGLETRSGSSAEKPPPVIESENVTTPQKDELSGHHIA